MWLFTGNFRSGIAISLFCLKSGIRTPVGCPYPIIGVERLTDGIALLCLSTTGLVLYHFGWQLLLAPLLIGLTGIILIPYRPLTLIALSLFECLSLVLRTTPQIRAFYDNAYTLWSGLLIGASAMLVFHLTRHVVISEVQGTGWEEEQRVTFLPMKTERTADYKAASASAHTGENII